MISEPKNAEMKITKTPSAEESSLCVGRYMMHFRCVVSILATTLGYRYPCDFTPPPPTLSRESSRDLYILMGYPGGCTAGTGRGGLVNGEPDPRAGASTTILHCLLGDGRERSPLIGEGSTMGF